MSDDAYIEHLQRDIALAEERVQNIAQIVAAGGEIERRWVEDADQDLARLRTELSEYESDRELAAFAQFELDRLNSDRY